MSVVLIALRFVQYGGAAILFGAALFFLYSPLLKEHEPPVWCKRLLGGAAAALILATPLNFLVQLVGLAGSLPSAMEPSAWHAALLEMNFGKSSMVRVIIALLALLAIVALRPGRRLWRLSAALGAVICASFTWMGHGAATEGARGWVHLGADILHSLAASGWIGALVVFGIALRSATPQSARRLHAALASFSGIGSFLVATILLTGLVNSNFLVGWDLPRAASTLYGEVLVAKILVFMVMLGLAAANRYRHTPKLAAAIGSSGPALADLRRSIGLETAAGFLVLALVSWLGTLEPVAGP